MVLANVCFLSRKKKLEVLAKPWVNPFEKCDFWDFKGMKFLLPKKVSFVSKILLNIISTHILTERKERKKFHF